MKNLSEMSIKNKLQEFCQKRGYPLPKYVCLREGGLDHKPQWRGKVTCIIKGEKKIFMTDRTFYSTKDATKQVAQRAFDHLQGINTFDVKFNKENKKCLQSEASHTFMLLDLENVPHAYRDFCERFKIPEKENQFSIIGFCSRAAGHIRVKVEREIKEYNVKMNIVEACSSHSDAADIRLSMWVGEMMTSLALQCKYMQKSICYWMNIKIFLDRDQLPLSIPFKISKDCIPIRIILVTGDHFGKSLTELIGSGVKDIHYPKIEWRAELYRCIEEIKE